jgi:hypothetical protein
MSQSVRQSGLFAGEDFTKVYRSFKNVNFQAYDYETIRSALIDYIRDYYPEDFNDYTESSEFVAIIELLSYMATTLSFRADLNSRENFLDTAQRRESIIRLARMLSYQPKRNIAANGLLKITSVKTTERVLDSLGRDLSGLAVAWNDPNNDSAYEQFVAILNAAFSSSNTFGRPFKSGTIGGIGTQLYRLNSIPFTNISYSTSAVANGSSYPIDIINVDFNNGETFFERHPNPENPMHLLYRNDNNGLTSKGTGFFTYFKQGELTNNDFTYSQPLENRTQEISVTDVNNQDVYVQKIVSTGAVLEEWTQVPSVVGNNIAYNDIDLGTKTIYSVISGLNDSVTIKFSDGNFGEVPKDQFRVWTRSSANDKIIFKPEDFGVKTISIPYTGNDGNEYSLTLRLELQDTVANGEPSETTENIRENAPQVFYSQNRMVNNEDYNTFPLTRGNEIAKLRTINRTHSGHSRYIDINDPTGSYSDVVLYAQDGAIYKELDRSESSIERENSVTADVIVDFIQEQLRNQKLSQFFFDEYLRLVDPIIPVSETIWSQQSTNSAITSSELGQLSGADISENGSITINAIAPGSLLKFISTTDNSDIRWVSVITALNDPNDTGIFGPITLSSKIPFGFKLLEIIPAFRSVLTEIERTEIANKINNSVTAFGLKYDYNISSWSTYDLPDINSDFTQPLEDWMLAVEYDINSGIDFPVYRVTVRGVKYIFESADEVLFYFDPEQTVFDTSSGKSLQDEIIVSGDNSFTLSETWTYDGENWSNGLLSYPNMIVLSERSTTENNLISPIPTTGSVSVDSISNGLVHLSGASAGDTVTITYIDNNKVGESVKWNIKDKFIQADGFVDQRKIEIKPVDLNEDGAPDRPRSFDSLVNQNIDRVYFEKFTDFDEYEYFKVWQGLFVNSDTGNITETTSPNVLYVNNENLAEIDFVKLSSNVTIDVFVANLNSGTRYTDYKSTPGITGTIVLDTSDPDIDAFYKITDNITEFSYELDTDHYSRVGKSFVNERTGTANTYDYIWKHYSPSENRIDPSVSNIQDMLILTQSYYNDILIWKEDNGDLTSKPQEPSAESLRVQFSDLNEFKMISDQLVFESGKFKILFGPQAQEQLRAKFKVVKLANAVLSDNEIKSKVIDSIDEFFNIANWDFGESFYYTELAAYIHQQLQNSVASVVLVPTDAESEFGNLFQIKAEPNELFISTARVDQVEIVKSLTVSNLRIKR